MTRSLVSNMCKIILILNANNNYTILSPKWKGGGRNTFDNNNSRRLIYLIGQHSTAYWQKKRFAPRYLLLCITVENTKLIEGTIRSESCTRAELNVGTINQQEVNMPNIRPLSEKLQLKAINELHEVPARLDEDIAALRTWIDKQPHLNACKDEQFLVAFLRGCKFSLEKAKDKIEKYYTLRTIYENQLTCRNVEDPRIRDIFALGIGVVLPKPMGEDGPRIMIIRPGGYPTEKYTMTEVMSVNGAVQDILLREDDNVTISGYVQILDFGEVTPAHFFQLNPSFMKKFSAFSEEALPLRHQGSHFINTPTGFDVVFNTIKPLMSPKMQTRLYVHGHNLEALYKFVPQKYLPKEYGGENGSMPEIIRDSCKNVLDHAEFFKNDAQYRTNEALRVGKPIDFDSVFGVEGSFRKLDFD